MLPLFCLSDSIHKNNGLRLRHTFSSLRLKGTCLFNISYTNIFKKYIWWFSQWTSSMSENISIMLVWWWKDSESIMANMPTFPKQSKCCVSTPKKKHVFNGETWDHWLFLQNQKHNTFQPNSKQKKNENRYTSSTSALPHLHLLSHLAICFCLTWAKKMVYQ